MPLPVGTIPFTGPIIDVTGSLLTATTALRDAGALSLRGAKLQRVNQAGDGWEDVPGHVVAATAPTTGRFEGQIWYDTTNNALMTFNGTAFVAVSGSVVFGSGSGEVATWAEGDSSAAFPLGKVDGAQEATQAPMRIRWSGTQAGLNATRFETGNESIGNTRDGVSAPTTAALNEFLGIWIGTAEANVLDIRARGASVIGDLFATLGAGEALTVSGTAGTVWRTAAAVSGATWMLQIFRANLNPLHFGDIIDARIRDDVSETLVGGSVTGHTLTMTRFDNGNPLELPLPQAREFARTNPVTFTGSGSPDVDPTNVNNGRIWNYTGNGTPTLIYNNPPAALGTWRAMVAHTGTGGAVTVQAPAGTTRATLLPGESGVAIFTQPATWAFVFVGKNPTLVSQTDAEAGTSADIASWSPERVGQAIAALQTGGVVFGTGAGEVSPIAEGDNTDVWPFGKLPVGVAQTQAEVRLRWNTVASWEDPAVVVSTTGVDIDVPDSPSSATRLEFLVRIDTTDELRDILIDDQDRSVLFTTETPTAFMLNNVLYQHYMTPLLVVETRTALAAGTLEVRLDANAHDQHIDYLIEEHLIEDPVIESISLSDDAFTTLNSAGQSVGLTWPSSVRNQAGGDGDGQVNALHAVVISEHNTSALTGAVSNPGNAFDGSAVTSVSFSSGGGNVLRGRIARTVYGGRVAIDVTPGTSVTFSLQFFLNNTARGTISTGAITSAGEHGFNAPLTTWNQVIITATAFIGGAATVREVRALDSGSALPGATTAQLAAETTAREAADAALGTRIDNINAAPSGDENLLDLVASTYPRDIAFTLGTRETDNSDPGYNAGTHTLTAAGSFAETGIPTDIVSLFRVTEAETVQSIQLQHRLIVGIDEPGGSTRYQGERIRWGAQTVQLTFLQRSPLGFNEYYSDVVTNRPTAGQSIAFNIEDVQAEARDALPYPRWIWHQAVATGGGTGLNDTQAGILSGFAYEEAGGTIIDSTTLTAAILGDGRVGYSHDGPLGSISPGNRLVYEISERTVASTREVTVTFGYEETGFLAGSAVEIDNIEYPFLISSYNMATNQTQVLFLTNASGTEARLTSGSTHAIRLKRSNGSYIEFTGSTYITPQVIFRDEQVVGFNLRNVPKDRFPDFLNFDEDLANTMRDLKLIVEERTPEEAGGFDDIVNEIGNAGATDHAFFFHIRDHDVNNSVRQYDHDTPDTSGLFPAGGIDFTRRFVLLIRDSLRGGKTPSNLLFWLGDGAQQTLALTLRTTLNTGQFSADPLTVYFTHGVPALSVGDEVSVNVEYSDDSRLHAPNPEAFNERTLDRATAQTWLGIAVTPQMQQALDYDFISSAAFSQDISVQAPANPGIIVSGTLQAVAVPQTPQIAEDCHFRLTFTQSSTQTGTARFFYQQGTNFFPLPDEDGGFIDLTGSGSIDLFLTEDYFDDDVLRIGVREPNGVALQFSYSATYDFYRSAESLKRSIVHRLINTGVQHTLTRNDFSVAIATAAQNMISFAQPFRLSELEYLTFELSVVNANNAASERITFTVYGDALRRQGTINISDTNELGNWHSVTGNLRTMIAGRFYPQPSKIEGATVAKINEVRTNGVHNGQPIFLFAFRRSGAFITGIQTISWAATGNDHRIGATSALLRR